MPSACTKPDNKASTEASDPIKQAINIVEKKVRNLEKRKVRLDAYREKAASGEELNADQQEAVSRYDSVLTNLEFAKELQKQFIAIQVEAEKLLKKQMKRDSHERQQHEIRRIKEVLAVQNLLDSLGAEQVRADFAAGLRGAVQLSEENLNQLDALYKLISPSRDGEVGYVEQLGTAAEHIANFLDGKEKEVAGTTYKNLKALIEQITDCGYFEKKDEEEVVEQTPEPEEPVAPVTEEAVVEEPQPAEPALDTAAAVPTDFTEVAPETQAPQMAALDFGLGANSADPALLGSAAAAAAPMPQAAPAAPLMAAPATAAAGSEPDETFFSTAAFPRQPRPFNEIVSSVQGSFDFLQDSEIESNKAGLDPAVVAAQMAAAAAAGSVPVTTEAAHYHSSSPASSATPGFEEAAPQSQFPTEAEGSAQAAPAAAQYEAHPDPATAYDDQTAYAQSLMTQSLQNTAQQYVAEQQAGYTAAGGEQYTASTAEPPQPIPMPPQQAQQQAYEQDPAAASADKNKKEFAMNPNADIFTSVYTAASGAVGVSEPAYQQAPTAPPPADKAAYAQTAAWNTAPQADFQQQGYYNRRGGSQGGMPQQQQQRSGYRGGQGGNRGMSNGYRGGNRGGGPSSRGGGAYNGRSNMQGGPRGGSGPGGKYGGQGYRGGSSDYPEPAAFQSYNNGFMGPQQGGSRGSSRGGSGGRGGRGGYNRMGGPQ